MIPILTNKEQRSWFFLLIACICLVLLPTFLTALFLDPSVYNNSSDTYLYLDIARNLFLGKGLVVSFNAYQFWQGTTYPALPFVHVGLSVFLAAAWGFLPSLKGLILLGFLPAVANSCLIAAIAMRMYRDRSLAFWAAVLVASSICTQITLLRILTEQGSLFLTLLAVYIFVSREKWNKPALAVLAVLLFLSALWRSAALLYPVVFALAMLVPDSAKPVRFKDVLFFAGISAGLILLWEGGIVLRYGVVSPQYPAAFKNYFIATRIAGGAFADGTPALLPLAHDSASFGLAFANVKEMFHVLYCVLRVLIVPAAWVFMNILRKGRRAEWLLVFLAVGQKLGPVAFYPFMKIGEFGWTRFLLVPVACLVIFGGKGLRGFCDKFLPRTGKIFFHALFAIILFTSLYQSVRVLDVYWQEERSGVKEKSLKNVKAWVLSHTGPDELMAASEYVIGNAFLERPVVVLPSHKTLSSRNLKDFLRVFSPRVLICEHSLPLDQGVLSSEGFVLAYGGAPGDPLAVYQKQFM
ncbi:MAG: hypothetical protein PHH75_07150 [Candidatus Omnitrophica bacterium]|nr:hypothetical protein [Candidatus Omnitrophota bacterium]MDD5574938.1 hypothetical protein [Candidatus Omnitrophota bacterium]